MMEAGWSLKHMHRLIVTSATYRQSSRARQDLLEIDPTNKLLARQVRLRVDAEIIRDLGLGRQRTAGPACWWAECAATAARRRLRFHSTSCFVEDIHRPRPVSARDVHVLHAQCSLSDALHIRHTKIQ